ncbi:putative phage associated protein [Cyanobium sp. Copco_Reservoir_LC18]|nr:putative phage associated protein [Cyanobium sp. Copco_Reservoir_LC18]
MQEHYWVVGAMFGGREDMLEEFVRRGYWYCWDPKLNREIPENVAELFPKIKAGDRLVVKKMLGQGSSSIQVLALGIVTDTDLEEWRVYVKWLLTDLSREVPIKNFMGSLHGPVEASSWRDSAFCI